MCALRNRHRNHQKVSMPKRTFKKHERLSRNKDIKRVFNKGRVFKHPALIMFSASRTVHTPVDIKTTNSASRFGIVITKKLGKATRRNRIKRLLREIIRLNKIYLSPCLDIVFLPRAEATLLDFHSLNKIVLSLWKRAGILKQHITAETGPAAETAKHSEQ